MNIRVSSDRVVVKKIKNYKIILSQTPKALILGRAEFVELCTEFHFDFQSFLTIENLLKLYTSTIHHLRARNLMIALGISSEMNIYDDDFITARLTKGWEDKFLKFLCAVESHGVTF